MILSGTTRLLGILGHPVAHSYSPAMHNAALQKHGLDFAYVPLDVKPENLAACVRGLKAMGFAGVNVTLPHKHSVIPLLDGISDLSRLMGAVNTVSVDGEGRLIGDTTDPKGFVEGFHAAGHSFDEKSVAVLGSGGSARTLAFALVVMTGALRVTLVARDPHKAAALAAEVHHKTGVGVDVIALADYPARHAEFDVVVNATPVGMHPHAGESPLPADCLAPAQIVYDLVYNPEETALLRDARARGCKTVGGLGMLVHQGMASFKLWTGVDPDPESFYEGIRRQRAGSGASA